MNIHCRSVILVVVAFVAHSSAVLMANSESVEIGYSFRKADSGGIAVVVVEPSTGKIIKSRVLLDSPECLNAIKLRRTSNGQLIVTNYAKKDPQLFIADSQIDKPARPVELPQKPDELRIVGNQGIVTCEQDILAVVDIARARVTASWDVGKIFDPKANGPQGIFITPDQRYAVISFQKDSGSGKKQGSRLAIYELPRMLRVADLLLPRNRPELHIPKNLKQQGPGPEITFVSGNTLMVTLDLYGGIGFMDWPVALDDRVQNWTDLSTSLDGRWGVAFPDRVCPISVGGFRGMLVCNAGVSGGIVLVDLDRRKIVWKRVVPPGLEHPVFIPELRKAFSVCSGKTKRREGAAVVKSFHPQKSLYCFDFSTRAAIGNQPVDVIPLDNSFAMRITRVGNRGSLLLIATGSEAEKPNQLVTFDPIENRILDSKPTVGTLSRFER